MIEDMIGDRFYLLESAGYRGTSAGNHVGRMPTEVMILDRYYLHRVVWSRWSGGKPEGGDTTWTLERVRLEAARVCAELNETERRELAEIEAAA